MPESLRDNFNQVLPTLGKLSDKLNPETKIYRTIDFFSVAQAVESGELRLTRMADFNDKNEGVDRLVRALISSVFGDLIAGGSELSDSETAEKLILDERRCRFVSCWSSTAESHAMWSMYSPDQCSVRLQTTVGRLHELGMSALSESWKGYSIEEVADPVRVINAVDVDPVEYVDVHWLLKRLARRKALAVRLLKRTEWTNDLLQAATVRHTATRWRPYLEAAFLKGEAYQYESEIRLTLKRSWTPHQGFREMIKGEMERNIQFHADHPTLKRSGFPIVKDRLGELRSATDETELFLKMPRDFIQSICVDPRAATYKKGFIERYFEQRGIAICQSRSFSTAYLNLSNYPNRLI